MRYSIRDRLHDSAVAVIGMLVTLTIVGAGFLVNELTSDRVTTNAPGASGVEAVVFTPERPRPTTAQPKPVVTAQTEPGAVKTSPRPQPRPDFDALTQRRLAEVPAPLARPKGLDDAALAGRVAETGAITMASNACSGTHASGIPARRASASTGSEFMAGLARLGGSERDRRIAAQVLAGNIPAFMRSLTPVSLKTGDTTVTICVTPDYVAIGDDADHVRVPMGLPAAAQIADGLGFMLPTTRMVDAIYADASVQLAPQPMTPNAQMTSNNYIRRHNATIERQLTAARAINGTLTAGHRKDIVLSNRLRSKPGRVAIYGWHRVNGRPIQPLSTVHGQHYADYSHGVRLVSRTAYMNGRAVDLGELLADARYAGLISDEGPIRSPARLIASLSN